MRCPLCSHSVTRETAACPRCHANFRAGAWRPLRDHRHFPGPGRVRLHALVALVVAALLAVLVPLGVGEGIAQRVAIAVPMFLALSALALTLVVARASRRGLPR